MTRHLSPRSVRALGWLAFATLLALGVTARLRTLPAVESGGEVYLMPTDAYYYGRLAKLGAAQFPAPVVFDSYVAFPGMAPTWPPGHVWLLAALLSGEDPFSPDGLRRLALAGPLLSLLGSLLVVALALRLFGARAALGTAAVLLVAPAAVLAGEYGEADHHLQEVVFTALVLVLLAGAMRRPWLAPVAGVAVGLAHYFTSTGFLLLPPLVLAGLVAHGLARPRRWRRARILLWTSAASLPLVAAHALQVGRLGILDYTRHSGFHVALVLGVTLTAAAPFLLWKQARTGAIAALGLGCLAGLAVLGAGGALEAVRALRHLGRDSLILSQALESLPLFAEGLGGALDVVGPALFAAPLVMALLLLRARRSPAAPLVLGILVALTFAMLLQERFARPWTGALAAAVALVLSTGQAGWRPARLAAGLVLVLVAVPLPATLQPQTTPAEVQVLTRSTLRFLREETPPTSGLWDLSQRPEYAVLAPWTLGHLIVTEGRRPVLASPLGQTREAEAAMALALRVFTADDLDEAAALAETGGARYLVATPWPGGDQELAALGGPRDGDTPGASRDPSTLALPRLLRGGVLAGRFRQVFVSSERFRGAPVARVYEIVEGNVLRLEGPPGAPVHLTATLRSSGDDLAHRARLPPSGVLEVRVPYTGDDVVGGVVHVRIGARAFSVVLDTIPKAEPAPLD